jgi:hypothetical protein
MSRPLFRRALPVGVTAAVLAATLVAAPVQAAPEPSTPGFASQNLIDRTLDDLARHLATTLHDHPDLLPTLATGPVGLADVGLAGASEVANQQVLAAKGLPTDAGPVLQVRLANPETAAALRTGATPLVVASPTDDQLTAIQAYRPDGQVVTLDPTIRPDQPVLVVEVDTASTVPLGLAVLRDELAAHGLLAGTPTPDAQSGYWATKITAIRLSDDKEPWIKGAAEIFSIVGGFGLDGKATVDIVDMPYLDHDKTTYYPNQLLVHFNGYKYDLADVVMMEDDGDTNYQALAQALITALLTIADLGVYIPLVGPILDALPSSWWTDDPDYVDSWYTLATSSSGRLYGAAGNGWMDVTPYYVPPL